MLRDILVGIIVDFICALYKQSKNENVMNIVELRNVGFYKNSYDREYLITQLIDIIFFWVIIAIISMKRDLSFLNYVSILIAADFVACMYENVNWNCQKLANKNDVSRRALRGLRKKTIIFACVILVGQLIISWIFCYSNFYVQTVTDSFMRGFTYICSMGMFYVFTWCMLRGANLQKDLQFQVLLEEYGKVHESSLKHKIATEPVCMYEQHSLYIVDSNEKLHEFNFREDDKYYNLVLVGNDCVVKTTAMTKIREVYDCKYILVNTTAGDYKKWVYDTYMKKWVVHNCSKSDKAKEKLKTFKESLK